MPITACFTCTVFLALILLVLMLPIALILFSDGRRRAAIALLGFPVGMIVLSALFTIAVLVMMWHYGVSLSRDPVRLFEHTVGFEPPPRTEILEAYAELGMDWENRVMTFRTSTDVIDRICAGKFTRSDRETCVQAYRSNAHNLPDRVRLWASPAVENARHFYLARPFDGSFGVHNEAILCYNEETGIACFHWAGMD